MVEENTEDMSHQVNAALSNNGLKSEAVDASFLAQLLGANEGEFSGAIVSSRNSPVVEKDACYDVVSDELFRLLAKRRLPEGVFMMMTRPLMSLDLFPPPEMLEHGSAAMLFGAFRRRVSAVIHQICEVGLNDTFDHDPAKLLSVEALLLKSLTVDGENIVHHIHWHHDYASKEEHAPEEGYDYFTSLVSPDILQEYGWDFCPHPGLNKSAFMAMYVASLIAESEQRPRLEQSDE